MIKVKSKSKKINRSYRWPKYRRTCCSNNLKNFPFSEVDSINITSGIPRIKEIINYIQKISTPVIYNNLIQEVNVTASGIVNKIGKSL